MALAANIPEVAPIYTYTAEIDTTPTGGSRTWATLCAGFDNIAEALNETVQQYFFLCGKGFATNYVTGMAPTITLTGRRVIGDAAQDYIFGLKYTLGAARNTHFRLTQTAEDNSTTIISANVTIGALQEVNGATTDPSAVSVELRFNGAPELGDEWGTGIYGVTQNLTHVLSSFTERTTRGGQPFAAMIVAETGYTLGTPTVTMGGTSASSAWDADTSTVTIASVTGNIVITASATPTM